MRFSCRNTRKASLQAILTRPLVLLVLCLCLAADAVSQSNTQGALGGVVTDPQKAVIVDAAVTARNLRTNAASTVRTDPSGRYLIGNLPPGIYGLTVSATNFSEGQRTNIAVEVGLVTNVEIQLGVAGTIASVTVSGQAPVINTEQSVFGTNFNETAVQNLPINARRWSNFALFTAGAVPDGTYGDLAFRGVGYVFNNNTVDGAANTQGFFAEEVGRTRMGYSTSLNSVQEFQVADANYSAEFGRAVGGVVNAVTKSGGNSTHGDVFYFNRDNSVGGAYQPFATAAVLQPNGTYLTEPIKPADIRQQFGGDIGGKLIKDRLFYYFNFDAFVRHFPMTAIPSSPGNFLRPITVSAPTSCTGATLSGSGVPKTLSIGQVLACRGFTQQQAGAAMTFLTSTTGTAPRTGNQTIYFPKLDWKPAQNQSVSLSYNRARWKSPYGIQSGSVVARGLDSIGNDYVHDDRVVANWTSILRNNTINEARFIFSKDNEYEFANPALPNEPVSPATGFSPQIDISGCGFSGGSSLACGWTFGAPSYLQRAAYPNERRYQGSDTLSLVRGRQNLKFGFDLTQTNDFLNSYVSADQFGEYSYTYLQDFLSDYIAAVDNIQSGKVCTTTSAGVTYHIPCWNKYMQTFGPESVSVNTLEAAFFAQDDWHATSRLTINAGLRYDHEFMPSPVWPNAALTVTQRIPTDNLDIAPRLGFAYDLTGSGKTVFRGGYGLYYGRITNEQIYEAIGLTGSASGPINLTFYPTTGTSNATGTPTPNEPIYPNVGTVSTSTVPPNIFYFPSDVRLPAAEEFDAVLEREIAPNTAVSLAYMGSIGRFLPIGVDTNLNPPAGSINYKVVGGPQNGAVLSEPLFTGTRPNPKYNTMIEYCSCTTSHYNAFVAQFNRRMSKSVQFNLSYTYASATDDGATTSNPGIYSNSPVNPFNLGLEEGTSPLEVRHRFVGSVVWQPAIKVKNIFAHGVLSGWTLAVIDQAQSGLPYGATISGNQPSGLGATVSSGGPTGGSTSSRVLGLPKNGFTLPGTYNTDMRIGRGFSLAERMRLEITAEAFNLFNHQNYTSASGTYYSTAGSTASNPILTYSTSFGQLTAANNSVFFGPRQLQFGAKLTF